MMLIIIGITGTLGAGKGTVVDYLKKEKAFRHYSVRAFLTEEIRRRKMPVNRDSMVEVANDLRTRHGSSHIIEKLYEQAARDQGNCIIESIRTPGEIHALRQKKNFVLLAVDARQQTRYQRIRKRASETDQISLKTFISNESREMHSDDPNKQNLAACIRLADHIIYNNGTITELHDQIELFLSQAFKKTSDE